MGNVRFLAKFDLTGRTSYKTCHNCFTIKALYFLNINDYNLYQRVNIHPRHSSSCYMHVGQKYMYLQTQHASIAT